MTPTRERPYSPEEERALLHAARRSLAAALTGGEAPPPTELSPCLREHRGCFVTLRSGSGRLRGCVGTFDTKENLFATVTAMTAAAARDSRFVKNPVTTAELDDLLLSVRVLTPLEPLADPLQLDVGNEGLYIIGRRDAEQVRGCFLPEVATEQGWDAAELACRCCSDKMRLPRDAWKPPTDLEFFRFRAVSVTEKTDGT